MGYLCLRFSLDFDDNEFAEPSSSTTDMSFSSNRLVRVPCSAGNGVAPDTLPGFVDNQEVVSVKCPKVGFIIIKR